MVEHLAHLLKIKHAVFRVNIFGMNGAAAIKRLALKHAQQTLLSCQFMVVQLAHLQRQLHVMLIVNIILIRGHLKLVLSIQNKHKK